MYFWLTTLPQGQMLDVWTEGDAGKKVLNVSWHSLSEVELTSFRRGDWEEELLNYGTKAAP